MLVVRMKNEPGVLSQCSKRLIFKPWLGRWLPRKVTFSSQSLLVCNAGVLQGTKYEDRLKVTLWKLKLTNHCWLWMDSTIFHQNLYWVPMTWIRVFGFPQRCKEATLSWQYWKLLVLEYQDHILSISGQILCIWELPCYRADIGNTFDRERTRAGRGVELESVCFLNTHRIISIHGFFLLKHTLTHTNWINIHAYLKYAGAHIETHLRWREQG